MPGQSDIDLALTTANLSNTFIGVHHHVLQNAEETARWEHVADTAKEFLSEQRRSNVVTAAAIDEAAREQFARKLLNIISNADVSLLPPEYLARTRVPIRRVVEMVIKAGFGD